MSSRRTEASPIKGVPCYTAREAILAHKGIALCNDIVTAPLKRDDRETLLANLIAFATTRLEQVCGERGENMAYQEMLFNRREDGSVSGQGDTPEVAEEDLSFLE